MSEDIITTIDGPRPAGELRRVEGGLDNDNEHTTWVEYWDGDRLVHRSVHVRLKSSIGIEPALATLG